jgi:hypothetical protein
LCRGPLEWHYLRTKFNENLSRGSKVISEGPTDKSLRALHFDSDVLRAVHIFGVNSHIRLELSYAVRPFSNLDERNYISLHNYLQYGDHMH